MGCLHGESTKRWLQRRLVRAAAYVDRHPVTCYRFSSADYVTPGAANYPFYMRKHNPPTLYDSVLDNPERTARIRNFNDFAVDATAGALPQWIFVTPNMVSAPRPGCCRWLLTHGRLMMRTTQLSTMPPPGYNSGLNHFLRMNDSMTSAR
jgi:hypothetical protein